MGKINHNSKELASGSDEINQGTQLIRKAASELREKTNTINSFVKIFAKEFKAAI